MPFDYATIVDGVVTDVDLAASSIPASTSTTLYWDITGLSPQPAVGWFFREPCNEFTESPLVIPPGEVAPPFTPGTTPPDPTDPSTPTVDEPGPVREALLSYHLTAFHATSADTVTIAGSDPEVEVTPRWRTTMNFAETCGVRLQAHVVTGGAVQLIAKGSTDGGSTWDYLNAQYEGPYLRPRTSGEAVGPFVNVDAPYDTGDVLVSVFARTAASETVTLGNLHLMHATRQDDGVCAVYEIRNFGCALPVAFYAVDYDGIEDDTALNADPVASVTVFGGTMDVTQRFFDNASLVQTFDTTRTVVGGSFLADLSDAGPWTGAPFADFTVLLRYEIEAGFDVTHDPGTYGDLHGLVLFQFETDDLADVGTTGPNWKYHVIVIRDATAYLVWDLYGTPSTISLGSAADWIGTPQELRVRMARSGASNFTVTISRNDACDDEVEIYTNTFTGVGTQPTVSYVYGIGYRGDGITGAPNTVWQYQFAFFVNTPTGCPLPDASLAVMRFEGYTVIGDFDAYVLGAEFDPARLYDFINVSAWTLDTTTTHQGNPTLFLSDVSLSYITGALDTTYPDTTVVTRFHLEGFTNDAATTNYRGGFVIASLICDEWQQVYLAVRNTDRLHLDWATASGFPRVFTTLDIGPASLVFDQDVEVIMRLKRTSDTTAVAQVYITAPCENPTMIHEETVPLFSTSEAVVQFERLYNAGGTQSPTTTSVRLLQEAVSDDATLFGLTP